MKAVATSICVELLGHNRQAITGRLATHRSNAAPTAVKIYICIVPVLRLALLANAEEKHEFQAST